MHPSQAARGSSARPNRDRRSAGRECSRSKKGTPPERRVSVNEMLMESLSAPWLMTMLSQTQRRSFGRRPLDRIGKHGEVAQRPRKRIRQNIRGTRDPILSNDTREQIWQFLSPGALPRFDVDTPPALVRSVKVPARHVILQRA